MQNKSDNEVIAERGSVKPNAIFKITSIKGSPC
jgi:hypothetical protein